MTMFAFVVTIEFEESHLPAKRKRFLTLAASLEEASSIVCDDFRKHNAEVSRVRAVGASELPFPLAIRALQRPIVPTL